MDAFLDPRSPELVAALDELLDTEPTGEQGECPWCEAIRAEWAGAAIADHRVWCPWARLAPLLDRLKARDRGDTPPPRTRGVPTAQEPVAG